MKRVIIFLSLCFFTMSSFSMQTQNFSINCPYYDARKQEYVIEAVNKINRPIGQLIYHRTTGNEWEMRKLEVEKTYRNQGIARALMAECISRLKTHDASQLIWKALSPEKDITEEQLIALYYRLLKKINATYEAKTTLEYRGDDNLHSPWLILDLQ